MACPSDKRFPLTPFLSTGSIEKAKWFRKCFGGGIRQCGSLATAASYALTEHLPLLPSTHAKAAYLAHQLADLGVRLLLPTETQMVWIDTTPLGFSVEQLVQRCATRGIRLGGTRIVVHIQITEGAVMDLIECVRELKSEHAEMRDDEEFEREKVDETENQSFAAGDWSGMQKPRKIKRLGTGNPYKK